MVVLVFTFPLVLRVWKTLKIIRTVPVTIASPLMLSAHFPCCAQKLFPLVEANFNTILTNKWRVSGHFSFLLIKSDEILYQVWYINSHWLVEDEEISPFQCGVVSL